MKPLFDLDLRLPPPGSRHILQALHQQLRAAIMDGRLGPGLRLPASRALAGLLGVSRSTTMAAYELLLNEGYLEARRGSGTHVAATLGQRSGQPAPDAALLARKLNAQWRESILQPKPTTPIRYDFSIGYPDQRQFPFDVWRRLLVRAVRAMERMQSVRGDPQGDLGLRSAIAQHVSSSRAVACSAEDVVVTAGAQQAMDLLARILVTPQRTTVVMEHPCYPALRTAFAAAGAQLCAVPVDAEGLLVEQLPARADVICVSPSHQSPMGATLSAARRTALLRYAAARDAVIIEDDYDGEFRLSGRPLDALQTLDRDQRVFYVGTFSKSMFASLRLGFVVTPPWARAALLSAKNTCNWHAPLMTQLALADFISEGHLARHVRKMRGIYAERHAALLAALQHHLGAQLTPLPALAGLHLTALLRGRTDGERWSETASAAGVKLESLSRYSHAAATPNGLIFGYGLIEAQDIDAGIAALKHALVRG